MFGEPLNASKPWDLSPQLLPMPSESDARRMVAAGASFSSVYMSQVRLLDTAEQRERYREWLVKTWRDESHPERAMAASIWAHILVHEGSLRVAAHVPALQDVSDGLATAQPDSGTRERGPELLRWSLQEHVVKRFRSVESEQGQRLRQIASQICGLADE